MVTAESEVQKNMRIRSDQIEQMRQAKQRESYVRVLADLRETSPQATFHLDDASLLAVIEKAAGKARAYGVTGEKATTAFVKMAVFVGISFDEDPTVRQYLQAPELDPDYKVILLAQLVSSKLRELS